MAIIYSSNSATNPNDLNSFEKRKRAIGLAGIATEEAAQVARGAVNAGKTIRSLGEGIKNKLGVQLYGENYNAPSPNSPSPNQVNQGAAGSQGASASQDRSGLGSNTNSTVNQSVVKPTITPTVPNSVFRSGTSSISQTIEPSPSTDRSIVPLTINPADARKYGFQLEDTTSKNKGTPIRGRGGEILSYADPNYSKSFENPSPNKSTISFDNGVGGTGSITSNKVFTPEQLTSLSKTIEYNNRPSTIANFAKQAELTQNRLDAFDSERELIKQELNKAYLDENTKGIDLYSDLLKNKDSKTAADAKANFDLQKYLLTSKNNQLDKARTLEFNVGKEALGAHQEGIKNLLKVREDILSTPSSLVSTYTSTSGRAPDKNILDLAMSRSDKYSDYQEAVRSNDLPLQIQLLKEAGIPEEYLGSLNNFNTQ